MIILTSLLLQVEELKEKRNRTGSTTKDPILVLINQRIGQTLMKY
jgi:hypothetical protein